MSPRTPGADLLEHPDFPARVTRLADRHPLYTDLTEVPR